MTRLRLALPSEGALYEAAGGLMRSCGLAVYRPSARRYNAEIPTLAGVEVLFQRASDITQQVDAGSADLGMVGLDRFQESRREGGDTALLIDDLGFGQARLVLAVPDEWSGVTSIGDLARCASERQGEGRALRIATKYPRLLAGFLTRHGISHFALVQASGGLEAAPMIGYADLIADISASGATLRENRLRPLTDGVVLESQATLIGNLATLREDDGKLALTRELLERVEAHLRAQAFQWIVANIEGESPEAVAERVMSRPEYSGLQGPTLAPVFSRDGSRWFSVQVVVPKERLIGAIDHMRDLGASGITINDPAYVFQTPCQAYSSLLEKLGRPLPPSGGGRG